MKVIAIMSQQQENNRESVGDTVNITEAMDLLFAPESLNIATRKEDEADCNVGAGLDWGSDLRKFIQNPTLLGRLTISDHNILRSLLTVLLTDSDWEMIANSAANSIRMQVMHRGDTAKISA
jgi:hypothetical protein